MGYNSSWINHHLLIYPIITISTINSNNNKNPNPNYHKNHNLKKHKNHNSNNHNNLNLNNPKNHNLTKNPSLYQKRQKNKTISTTKPVLLTKSH